MGIGILWRMGGNSQGNRDRKILVLGNVMRGVAKGLSGFAHRQFPRLFVSVFGKIRTNSSPPYRPTISVSRSFEEKKFGCGLKDNIASLMAIGVIDEI